MGVRALYVTDTSGDAALARRAFGEAAFGGDELACVVLGQGPADVLVAQAARADVVVLAVHSGPSAVPGLGDVAAVSQGAVVRRVVHVQVPTAAGELLEEARQVSAHATSGGGGDALWAGVHELLAAGGMVNTAAAWRSLLGFARTGETDVPAPKQLPAHGVYDPAGETHDSSVGLKTAGVSAESVESVAVVWFPRKNWVDGNIAHIDAMCAELARHGVRPVAVFGDKFPETGWGVQDILPHYAARATGNHAGAYPGLTAVVCVHPLSLTLRDAAATAVYEQLGVPVIQALVTGHTESEWRAAKGVTPREVSTLCAQPEFDGVLTGPVVATTTDGVAEPVPEGCAALGAKVAGWAALQRTPAVRRKVAVIFHHHPPRMDQIGCATGINTFASAAALLGKLAEHGYDVGPVVPTAEQVERDVVGSVAAHQQWLSPAQLHRHAHAHIPGEAVRERVSGLPQEVCADLARAWGDPPGTVFAHDDQIAVAGVTYGNVFCTVGPPRGILEKLRDSDVHDPTAPPPYHYLEHYRWLREDFGAHAVVHFGTHGSAEWLPGNSVGLTADCYPELALGHVPNINPYIVNNPGEGTGAKRRGGATLVGHVPAPVRDAGMSVDMSAVADAVADFHDAAAQSDNAQRVVAERLWTAVADAGFDVDFGLDRDAALADVQHFVEHVHHHLLDLADHYVQDGLHTLGTLAQPGDTAPDHHDRLVQYLVGLLRVASPNAPSLRDEMLRLRGHTAGQVAASGDHVAAAAAQEDATAFVRRVLAGDAASPGLLGVPALQDSPEAPDALESADTPALRRIATHITDQLLPRLGQIGDELDQVVAALDGRYVSAGPSGAPGRGAHDVLPTGRNFFSLDPRTIPTPAAVTAGWALADSLLDRQRRVARHGAAHGDDAAPAPECPHSVALTLWGTATMRTRGEDVAQVLALMGLRPRWDAAGHVTGLDVVSLAELGRPRVDVTVRISGFFRDAFSGLVDLLAEASTLVAALAEPVEQNFVRAHVIADAARYGGQTGGEGSARPADATGAGNPVEPLPTTEAWRQASQRVFGPAPGHYGSGVTDVVTAKTWHGPADLAAAYRATTTTAYGPGGPTPAGEALVAALARVDTVTHTTDTTDYDVLASDDAYSDTGGLIAAVTAARGQAPLALHADATAPDRPRHTRLAAQMRVVARTTLLNLRWQDGMRRSGFSGAAQVARAVTALVGWAHTADVVDDQLLTLVAQEYLSDGGGAADWLAAASPAAGYAIADALLDAAVRGTWSPPPEVLAAVRDAYVAAEGAVEEAADAPAGAAREPDVQGPNLAHATGQAATA